MSDVILVITPARNESENLPELNRRLSAALDSNTLFWRWLIVDDASNDDTFAVANRLADADARIAAVALAARAGSHRAIFAGLRLAAADPVITAVAILACDLEDPPEALPGLIDLWRSGAQIVFARRAARPDVSVLRPGAAILCHGLVRLALGGRTYPWAGADMVVLGRAGVEAIAADERPIGNIFVRIARLGLPAAATPVTKSPRFRGASQWSRAALWRMAAATIGEAFGVASGPPAPPVAAAAGWAADRISESSI